ncbi:24040_t:CDS:2, partial [Racocetra persica]
SFKMINILQHGHKLNTEKACGTIYPDSGTHPKSSVSLACRESSVSLEGSSVSFEEIYIPDQNLNNNGSQLVLLEDTTFNCPASTSTNVDLVSTFPFPNLETPKQYQKTNKEENDKLQKDLANTEKKLAVTKKELESTNKKLVTEKELKYTNKKLA